MTKMVSLPYICMTNAAVKSVLQQNHLRTTDLIYITVDGALLHRAWLGRGVKD